MPFFFTGGTLLGFGGGFGSLDALLEFLLKSLLEKFSTFVEEEGFHKVKRLSVRGVISDEVAFVQ